MTQKIKYRLLNDGKLKHCSYELYPLSIDEDEEQPTINDVISKTVNFYKQNAFYADELEVYIDNELQNRYKINVKA